jgi:hypothetical protein
MEVIKTELRRLKMIYKPLKLMLIAATIFVWIRLLMGTLQALNDPDQTFKDNHTIISQNTQLR